MSNSTSELVIGIDAGGTEIKAGILQGNKILEEKRFDTQREVGPEHSVNQIVNAAVEMQKIAPKAKAVGLVVPGVIDSKNGIVEYSENLLWKNVNFGSKIAQATNLPWSFGHDVRVAGLAESIYGAGINFQDQFFLSIGTGIAGAIIVEEQLIDNPYCGEIGHFNVQSGYLCACGIYDCLESISTAPSIARTFQEKSGIKVSGSKEVLELAIQGNQIAENTWNQAMEAIGKSVTAYINILAPQAIIFGGGVSNAGEKLIEPVKEYVDHHLTFQKRPQFLLAQLGDKAGMIGAGIIAARKLR